MKKFFVGFVAGFAACNLLVRYLNRISEDEMFNDFVTRLVPEDQIKRL